MREGAVLHFLTMMLLVLCIGTWEMRCSPNPSSATLYFLIFILVNLILIRTHLKELMLMQILRIKIKQLKCQHCYLIVNLQNSYNYSPYIKMNSHRLFIWGLILAMVCQWSISLTYPPVWVTNSYVQASNNEIISTLTGNNLTPTYTFTFPNAFPNIPNLGYGIKKYQGNDYFGEEKFEVNRTALTTSTFSVAVQILGTTNIYVMNVPFIAIDPTFPHHLNSFDNVPVNYGTTLTNITVQNPSATTYYSNTINYTQQVGGSSIYDRFLTPLSRNKILLFMTSLFIEGHNQNSPPATVDGGPPFNPLDFRVNATVVSTDQYRISVSLSIYVKITKLHFSIIAFDEQDVESTGLYMLVYERISFTDAGGFIPIPFQFINNFIMGFTDFSSIRTKCAIHFQWDFQVVSGVEGVLMPVSVGRSPTGFVINRVGFTLFYMKTWLCPSQTFFDPAQNLCTGCPIYNCLNCMTINVCAVCDTANGYTLNRVTFQCDGGQSACSDCDKVKIQRNGCNGFMIQIAKQLYQTVTNVSISNQNVKLTKYEQIGSWLQISAEYSQDLLNATINLTISGNYSRQIPYNPVTPSVLYSKEECDTMENVSRLFLGLEVMSYVVLLFSIISLKIVGLQLFGILQVSYFTLISHSYFDLYLSPITKFKTFNGLNINLISTNTTGFPGQITQLGMSSAFLNNFNIMLFITLLQLIIGVVLYLVGKFFLNQRARTISAILLKQGFITLILFNIFNVSFSAGLQWKYDKLNTSFNWANNLVLIICLLGILAAVVLMEISPRQSHYGEFKKKFKNTWTCRIYILLSIIMRMCLGVYSAIQNEYQQSTLFILAIAIAFVMYNLINLPFNNPIQNYRACFCHITMLVILLTTNYYRSMKSNTPMLVKAHIHTPAILEIVLITICVVFSVLVLSYEIWKMIKNYKESKVVMDEKAINNDGSKMNLQQITENSIEVLNN